MPISIIPNQPIRLSLIDDAESCECGTKEYCQMINKNDQTQWQIKSTDIILNGSFTDGLNHWVIGKIISVHVDIVNESAEGVCDGSLTIIASEGMPAYQYSLDGITFQSSNEFDNLCADCYNIIVKDSEGNKGYATACVDTNIDCGTYPDAYLFDLENINLSKLLNCYLHDLL